MGDTGFWAGRYDPVVSFVSIFRPILYYRPIFHPIHHCRPIIHPIWSGADIFPEDPPSCLGNQMEMLSKKIGKQKLSPYFWGFGCPITANLKVIPIRVKTKIKCTDSEFVRGPQWELRWVVKYSQLSKKMGHLDKYPPGVTLTQNTHIPGAPLHKQPLAAPPPCPPPPRRSKRSQEAGSGAAGARPQRT